MFNKESADVQSGFRHLAMAWGWPAERIIVIDEDQGRTATSTEGRSGFQRLLTEVNLNHVGIIFGFQVSRLSRANSNWYHLLERCAVFQTLLADMDGVYDPTQYNDRLLLGLKGTMSEGELHLLGQRLYEARLSKARKGEQFTSAPIGYVRSPCGNQLERDPDEQVQAVVQLIFDKFDELGSVGALLRYLVHHDIKLGFRQHNRPDAGQLQWRPPRRPTLNRILRHPYYAGCYAFGFSQEDPRRHKPGRPFSGIVRVPRLKWGVMIPDAVPAYITWQRYLANQQRLAANRCLSTTLGAPRSGPSLLSGLVYCGRCGQRMAVAYHAKGDPVYYLCNRGYVERAAPVCQSLAGNPLEDLVAAEVLRAIEPAEWELHEQALADLEHERQRLDQHWQQRLERAQIQADRAARQYHAVEPENRLVARELERRWEQALGEQRELKEEYDRFRAERPRELTAADRQRLEALAQDIPGLWHASTTTIQERQQIVRFLVERITVVLRGQTEWADVTIRWAGGMESRHTIRRPVQKYAQLSNYQLFRARLVELRRTGATAAAIAERLNAEGFQHPRGSVQFNRHVINQCLAREGLSGAGANRRTTARDLGPHEWRLDDLARELKMSANTLREWGRRGWVRARKSSTVNGCWVLWADEGDLDRLRRLRAWRRGGYNRARPSELTTPGTPRPHETPSKARTARSSGRNSPSSKRRKLD
jgi:DNA invertase Pin-like site-specific DNA recombinase